MLTNVAYITVHIANRHCEVKSYFAIRRDVQYLYATLLPKQVENFRDMTKHD